MSLFGRLLLSRDAQSKPRLVAKPLGKLQVLPPLTFGRCAMKGFRKQTQKAVKLISDCFEHRPFLRWYCSTPGRGRSSENTCSRAPFRLGCGDAQGAGGEADLVFRKVWRSEGTVFPHCPPEAPGHGKLRGGRSTASLEEENRLLPKRHHLRAGSQPCVTWC